MNKQDIEKAIEGLYEKWSTSGLNEYEKIALKHYEKQLKTIHTIELINSAEAQY